MHKISILIPIYNASMYLKKCLESVINQTYSNLEIICINDGSTDNSLDIIQEYAKNDSRIKIINKPNSGYGASMNMGIDMASGEYIGIVESDDYIEHNMYEKLYKIASEFDLDIARCQYYEYRSQGESNIPIENLMVTKNTVLCPTDEIHIFNQAPAIWCNLVKKELLINSNIKFLETKGASYQDTSFAFKLYACAKRFMMISDYLLHYRMDNEASSVNSKEKTFFVCKEYDEISKFAKHLNNYNILRYYIPLMKFGCYKWNFNRLSKNLKFAFLMRMQKEFLIEILCCNLRKKYFEKNNDFKKFIFIAFIPFIYAKRENI